MKFLVSEDIYLSSRWENTKCYNRNDRGYSDIKGLTNGIKLNALEEVSGDT